MLENNVEIMWSILQMRNHAQKGGMICYDQTWAFYRGQQSEISAKEGSGKS